MNQDRTTSRENRHAIRLLFLIVLVCGLLDGLSGVVV
jgi:hypothetical protein